MKLKKKLKNKLLSGLIVCSCISGTGGVILLSSTPVFAATGSVPPEITTAVADAKASVSAIAGVSTVALAVGLSPLGAMLSLRFLNMILSRV